MWENKVKGVFGDANILVNFIGKDQLIKNKKAARRPQDLVDVEQMKKVRRKRGKNTSKVEVVNISVHGIWLYVNGKEYFLSHEEYPWFKDAKIKEIYNVQLLHESHLRWPDLDVDLELDSFENPEKYPLIFYKKK